MEEAGSIRPTRLGRSNGRTFQQMKQDNQKVSILSPEVEITGDVKVSDRKFMVKF